MLEFIPTAAAGPNTATTVSAMTAEETALTEVQNRVYILAATKHHSDMGRHNLASQHGARSPRARG